MKFLSTTMLLAVAAVVLTVTVAVYGSADEERLLDDLFTDYKRQALPNKVWNDSVTVEFGVSRIKLHEVDEEENSITVKMWLHMEFMDYRLKWNPDEYGGLNKLKVPFENLWLPDIVLYNGLTGSKITSSKKVHAVVGDDGSIQAISPTFVTASCEMDLALFPYDSQSCSLRFASWTSSASVIDLQLLDGNQTIKTASYSQNSYWNLENSSLARNEYTYCCPSDKYVDITATLEISRRYGPYTNKLVIPSMLIVFLILFTFILPSSSGEIIVFCLLLFLALLLLHDNLQKEIPSNSDSVLGEFLTFGLFMDFFATIIAVINFSIADPLMHDGNGSSKEHRAAVHRKLKALRIAEFVCFFIFLIVFIIGASVFLTRRG